LVGVEWEPTAARKEHLTTEDPAAPAIKVEDIAAAVAFFAREDSGYITGQILYVSGGPEG